MASVRDLAGALTLTAKFLIDECLSVGLVAIAKTRGHYADHVSHLGKIGWQDWNLVPFALANDYIVVTNNRADFLKRYAKIGVHSGLVIIVPSVKRADQARLFEKALDTVLSLHDDLVNRVVEVLIDDSVHVREWTSLDHDPAHISRPKWR